jgi:rubrerythrin
MSAGTKAKSVVLSYLKQAMEFTSISPVIAPTEPMDDRELARAIRLSIAAEEDAASTYKLIADSCSNKDIKKIIENISAEEVVHIGEFQKLLSMVDKDEDKLIEEGKKEVEEKLC